MRVLFLLFLLSGLAVAQTEGWSKLTDPRVGYSLRYPNTLRLEQDAKVLAGLEAAGKQKLKIKHKEVPVGQQFMLKMADSSNMNLTTEDLPAGVDAKRFATESWAALPAQVPGIQIGTLQPRVIGKNQFYAGDYKIQNLAGRLLIAVEPSLKRGYVFVITSQPASFPEAVKVFERVLATLKLG